MKEVIVIDPVSSSRAAISLQLNSLGLNLRSQYQSLEEAWKQMPRDFKGIFFISMSEGVPAIANFVTNLRVLSPSSPVLAVASAITIDEMRSLISMGVDQVMIRPFNANQLKEKTAAAINFRDQVQKEELLKPSPLKAKFEAKVDAYTEKFYKISLSGWLGEGCGLPDLKIPTHDGVLFLDCDQLWGMNSVGIRLWSLWLKSLSQCGFQKIEFENFRPNILQTASLLKNLFPPHSSINSFYLRYWNEETEKEIDVRLTRGQNFPADKMTIPKTHVYKVDGQEKIFEVDENLNKILFFFQGAIELV